MTDWTPEYRLSLVDVLSRWISSANETGQQSKVEDYAICIYFLATAADDFLERNRANYADAIKQLHAEND